MLFITVVITAVYTQSLCSKSVYLSITTINEYYNIMFFAIGERRTVIVFSLGSGPRVVFNLSSHRCYRNILIIW